MATAVRPPGYYTSWLHVVTNIPNSTDLDLYQWIGDWTQLNYGHRWTNESKKLNAILTITENTIIQASTYSTLKLNENINPSNVTPAIFISTFTAPGQPGFRDFDRITIINKGRIIGAYGFRDYGVDFDESRTQKPRTTSGTLVFNGLGTFTPPAIVSNFNVTLRDNVTSVNLQVAGGGGRGGDGHNPGSNDSIAGAGGGGGGAGGLSTVNNRTISPGVQISANGGGSGDNTSYSQSGITGSLAAASAGSPGGGGFVPNREEYCKGWDPFGICFNTDHRSRDGTVGAGGAGGRDLINNVKNGNDGKPGTAQDQVYASSGCKPSGIGGAGGVGAGGNGGKGGMIRGKCSFIEQPQNGQPGWHLYNFTHRQLFGPAIKNRHTNIRIINEGVISGGYSDGQTIFAVYGAITSGIYIQNEFNWGNLYPSSPGVTTTIL